MERGSAGTDQDCGKVLLRSSPALTRKLLRTSSFLEKEIFVSGAMKKSRNLFKNLFNAFFSHCESTRQKGISTAQKNFQSQLE